jgi:50S ribosomal subunit-associated GTPase HflX
MVAATKRDAVGAPDPLPALRRAAEGLGLRTVPVSAVSGEGLPELKQQLLALLAGAERPATQLLGQS